MPWMEQLVREDIAIEKTPDAIDEVQLAGERELAIRNLDRNSKVGYTRIRTVNCNFTFDESVPSEKALQLLMMLARRLQERGGRLCFGGGEVKE